MKKLLALTLSILMVATMAACGGDTAPSSSAPASDASSASSESASPAQPAAPAVKTVSDGKLTIGTSADFAPYEFHVMQDGKDTIVGFDIALAQAIADDLGLTLEIKDIAFDSILMELNAGTIDLGIAGFSPDPERAKSVDFSNIYYTGGQSMMINKKDADKFKSYTDLNSKDFTVGAQTGSIQEGLAKTLTPDANYLGLQAVPNVIMDLVAGKTNAAYIETVVAETYAKTQQDVMVLCEVPYEAEGSAVALKKGNADLLAAVNKTIDKLVADGTIGQFVADANAMMDKEVK